MPAEIIDGKAFAAALRARVAAAAAAVQARHGIKPGLSVVLVGENPASQVYVRNKERRTKEAGIASIVHRLPNTTGQSELLALIARLNDDPAISGILVQLPLPGQIDAQTVIDAIDPAKDVDGFHAHNAGRLATGVPGMEPCTPLGCLFLLRGKLGDLSGRNAIVIGRSNIVGKPMASLLLGESCTVTVAHSRTRNLPEVCRRADVLVAAIGQSEMVRGDWIAPGACVIDVGINRVPARDPDAAAAGKTRLVGDVAFDEAREVAGSITPVPGGVGPVTIAVLLRNTLVAACRQNGVSEPEL